MADDNAPPVVPSGWQLQRAVSAWLRLREEFANDPDLIDDEATVSATLAEADIAHPAVLLEHSIDALIWIDRREKEADDLRREMTERRDRYRERKARVRGLVEDLLVGLEMKSRRGRIGAASIVTGQPSLVLTDEQLVPDQYYRTERTLMKTPLIEDLEQGVVVPGAVMSNPGPVLRIRKL